MRSHNRGTSMRWSRALWVIAVLAGACGSGRSVPPAGAGGRVQLALTATAASTTYALANATFLLERIQPPPTDRDISGARLHQLDPTAGDLTASLDVGRYTVTLLDGWQLERVDSPTKLVPVEGTLLSPNPVTVSVFSGQTTFVTFQFQTTGIPLTFGPGMIAVGI